MHSVCSDTALSLACPWPIPGLSLAYPWAGLSGTQGTGIAPFALKMIADGKAGNENKKGQALNIGSAHQEIVLQCSESRTFKITLGQIGPKGTGKSQRERWMRIGPGDEGRVKICGKDDQCCLQNTKIEVLFQGQSWKILTSCVHH